MVANLLLALRHLSELVLSPLGGLAAQRWGATRMLIGFSLFTAVALVAFGCHWLVVGGGPMLAAVLLPLAAPVWVYSLAALALAISALACAQRRATLVQVTH